MKKLITIFILSILAYSLIYSQTDTRGFSFQGYAVDQDGKALGSTAIKVKFSIHPQSSSISECTEEIDLTTDAFGVFVATIGSQSSDEFKKLNFNSVVYNLKVEVKKTSGGSEYITISDAQLLSVPYARSASNGVPVGSIIPFGGKAEKIPAGWLACDGTTYDGSKPAYAQLYDVLGNSWGGSGTTFNVPDLRGYFLRGVDPGNSRDIDAGGRSALYSGGNTAQNVGSYEGDQYAAHNHSASAGNAGAHTHDYVSGWGSGAGISNGGHASGEIGRMGTWNTSTSAGDHSHTITVNNNGGTETRPKNANVFYIIKY
jgi:microcystin-dependent protein